MPKRRSIYTAPPKYLQVSVAEITYWSAMIASFSAETLYHRKMAFFLTGKRQNFQNCCFFLAQRDLPFLPNDKKLSSVATPQLNTHWMSLCSCFLLTTFVHSQHMQIFFTEEKHSHVLAHVHTNTHLRTPVQVLVGTVVASFLLLQMLRFHSFQIYSFSHSSVETAHPGKTLYLQTLKLRCTEILRTSCAKCVIKEKPAHVLARIPRWNSALKFYKRWDFLSTRTDKTSE